MTKEDYMKLSKERLAELLVERDNKPYIISSQPNKTFFPHCCGPNGVCTNPLKDCINCPMLSGGVVGSWNITTTNNVK